jgi:DNA-binding response OmpR family regulator
MPRLFYIHWNKPEAIVAVRELRAAGYTVAYHSETGEDAWKLLNEKPPDALVISLARLPSHGRRVAAVTVETKKLREVPIIFVGGEAEKVRIARKEFPVAAFCESDEMIDVVRRVVGP